MPTTIPAERLLALKYLLHFVGDVHQPLHASDKHDRGGSCVLVSLGGSRTVTGGYMAKLKVYRTPIGFHDAYVAATSQKAALQA